MKKGFVLHSIICLLTISCSVHEIETIAPILSEDNVFYATFESYSEPDTKVFLDENIKILWDADDRITIFNKNTFNQQYRFTGDTGDNSGFFKIVPSDDFATGNDMGFICAVYPYLEATSISNSGVLTLTLPAEQAYREESFGPGANTMISSTSDNLLRFKNVGGYLALKFYGDDVSVSSIKLEGNHNEPLSGDAALTPTMGADPLIAMASTAGTSITLTCETPVELGATKDDATIFWIVVPPTDFTEGFKLTVTAPDGRTYVKETDKDLSIARNGVLRISPIQVELSEPIQPDNVIYYTSSDGQIVTPYKSDVFGAHILSNKYINGRGIITFDGNVSSIGDEAFRGCNHLTSITLPKSVTIIGEFAFYYCSNLATIIIPDSVTSIGQSAFQASSLRSITLPESVTIIGSAAFAGCKDILSISIPESITNIESYTFQGCSNLVLVTIPDGVESIRSGAFQSCTNLQSIDLPQSIKRIESSAFAGCTSLSSITIRAETVPVGGQQMFLNTSNCPIYVPAESVEAYKSAQYWSDYADRIQQGQPNNVIYYTSTDGQIVTPYDISIFGANIVSNVYVNGRGTISFDGDVRSIGKNAFYQCKTLSALSIPQSVTTIGDWAFAYCSSISSITIPEGVKSIRDRAFLECTSLVSIFIPGSVTTIGVYVFNSCSSLASIVVSSDNQYYDSRENCNAIIRKSNNKLIRGTNNTIIPDGITSIDSYAFSDCSKMTAITIPNTVTSIGNYAFFRCSSLRSISIPEGVTTIDIDTFYGCSSLNTVNLPSSLTSIKDDAFGKCTSLGSIIIPQSVTSIGQYAFYGCSKLSAINIPESITTIMDYTFTSCTSLTTIDLPSNLYLIRPGAFKGCSGLLSITIPESVMYIQKEAFYNCSSLTSVIVNCLTPPSGSSPGSYLMFENTGNCPIYVPAESVAAYKASQDWKSYANRIQAIPE